MRQFESVRGVFTIKPVVVVVDVVPIPFLREKQILRNSGVTGSRTVFFSQMFAKNVLRKSTP